MAHIGKDMNVEVLRLNEAGQASGPFRQVGRVSIGALGSSPVSLVSTGAQLVVVYQDTADALVAQLLDGDGSALGTPTPLPTCLISSTSPARAAWGSGTVAVVFEAGYSGRADTAVCVAQLRCQQ